MPKKADVRETVSVISDYSYKVENSNETISLKVGEEYQLIKKVNDDWWYVQKGQSLPPFYIPASYVKVVPKGLPNIEIGGKSPVIGGSGDKSLNVTTGDKSPNVTTGDKSLNVMSGDKSTNVATGDKSPNIATGDKSRNVSTGDKSPNLAISGKSTSLTSSAVTSPTSRVPPKPKPRVSKSASEDEALKVLDEAIDNGEVRGAVETRPPDKEKAKEVGESAKSQSVESVVKSPSHPPFPNPPSLVASTGLPSSTGPPAPSGSSDLSGPSAVTPPISPTDDEINYVNLDEYQQMVKERKENLIDGETTDMTTVVGDNPAESETSDYRSGDSKGGSRESLDSDSQGRSCDSELDKVDQVTAPLSVPGVDESAGKHRADPILQPKPHVTKVILRGGNVGPSDYANLEDIRKSIHPQMEIQTTALDVKKTNGGTPAFEVPSGWTVEVEDGVSTFTNNALGQKWTSAVDKDGRNYFYNVSTHVTVWNLTDVPTLVSSSVMRGASSSAIDTTAAAAKAKDRQTLVTSAQPDKSQSSWARHGLLNKDVLRRLALSGRSGKMLEGATAEAEPNLSEAAAEFPALEPLPIKMVQKQGPLGKAKAELGKKSKKPAWSQSYAVLLENTLYFYKDQKLAAGAKPKSVNSLGKPELVLDLTAGQLSSSPDEKKNLILVLTLSKGDVFLLHNESEDVLQHWKESLENNIEVLVATPVKDVKDVSIMKAVEGVARLSSYIGVLGEERVRIADKLLHWLKRRPTKETLKAKGILKEAVFGSSLTELCEREKTKIPRFVHECIVAVEKRGLEVEGVYRVGGNMANVQKLRQMVDNNEFYELNSSFWDIHVVTGALKLFFRELSEPLFTFALFEAFLDAYKLQGRTRQVKAIRDIVRKLPTVHRETMKELFKHLTDVICHTTTNRMNTQALAIVFGPTLLWPEAKNKDINLAASMVYQGQVVEFMIIEFRAIFS